MDRDMFKRYLNELAEQLGPSDLQNLPSILINRLLPRHFPVPGQGPSLSDLATSFEALFQYLFEQGLVSCNDIGFLQEILDDLSKPYLLYPFYEAYKESRKALVPTIPGGCTAASSHKKKMQAQAEDFALLLIQIGNRLSQENVRILCYLLQDLLSRFKAATLQDGVEVLQYVKQRHFITPTQPCFLLTLLKDIDREDLCHTVEEYKMSHIEQPPPPLSPSPSTDTLIGGTIESRQLQPCCVFFEFSKSYFKSKKSEEESGSNNEWTRREYRFRLAMKKLADKLCPRDLESMKLLAQSIIPPAELDKIESIIDFFWLLEDHAKLSIDDLYILEELLDEKNHLLDSIYSELWSSSSQSSSRENSLTRKIKHKVTTPSRDDLRTESMIAKSFQKMLKCIGSGLTQKETKHLKVLDPSHDMSSIKTGLELMYFWKKVKVITERNLDLLRKGLYAIGRQDLCQHIVTYHSTIEVNPFLPIEETTTALHQSQTACPSQRESEGLTTVVQQCTEDQDTNKLRLKLERKERAMEDMKGKLAELEAKLHQMGQDYKQLQHQNHSLLLHNHELTVEVSVLEKQLDMSLLAINASKNGIFLSTPV